MGRKRRQKSARQRINGTTEKPRLVVHRSNNHLYGQVIDDSRGHTLVAFGTVSPSLQTKVLNNNIAAAKIVGEELAKRCISKGISKVVFDRAGYKYHGRIKALADAARDAGLLF